LTKARRATDIGEIFGPNPQVLAFCRIGHFKFVHIHRSVVGFHGSGSFGTVAFAMLASMGSEKLHKLLVAALVKNYLLRERRGFHV
jgi:hypothetical protein